ncbi:MAG: LysR family transcriptional regulator [Pseudomonadota bacterium]
MPTLRNVNLNLLPILHALLHHRSVTRAGEALNMSQSAVSDALANLRHVFGDPLLIKSGRQMLLTDLAKSLIPQAEEAVSSIQKLLDTPDLDPAALSRRFVIATADSVMMTIGPTLISELMYLAPTVSVQFVSVGTESIAQGKTGEIDLLIGPSEVMNQIVDYHSAWLYDDEFVCIMRKNHPLSKSKLTSKAYWSAIHASYRPDSLMTGTLEAQVMRREGENEFDVVRIPEFTLLPFFVESTDCLAMVSRRVAERMKKNAQIVIRGLPFQQPPIPMSMFWNDIKHNDPAHRWFRTLLTQLKVK